MIVQRLLEVLARERSLLETLLHRMRIVTLLLAAGEGRFLSRAADEVLEVSAELAETETLRAVAVADEAERLGLRSEDLTLRSLAAVAEARHRTVLLDHRQAMAGLVDEIAGIVAGGTELASLGLGDVRATLERMATGSRDLLYGRDGASANVGVPPTRFDARA